MRTRLTLSLLAANLVLFGLIFYLNHQGHTDGSGDRSRRVFGAEAKNLDYLEIRLAAEEEPRVLRRDGEKWNVRGPIQWPANVFAVNRILQQIEFLEKETSFRTSDLRRTGQSLDHYGLDSPRAVLVFGRGSQRYEVRVGEPTDIGNRLYILDPSGELIHVVHREFAQTLSLSLNDLRSETVFHIPLFEVRSLNVQLGTHSKVRVARKDQQWRFETPFQTRADRKAVEAVVNRLNGLQIRGFEKEEADPADFGLNNPSMRITLDGNGRRETLLIGSQAAGRKEPHLYAKLADNPTVFTLAEDPLEAIRNAQDLLRDRKVLNFERNPLTSINLAIPGGTEVLLQKLETDQWQIVSRFEDQSVRILPADTALVDRLLDALEDAHVLKFENDAPSDADLARYGFDRPQRVVTLAGETPVELMLGGYVPDSKGSAVYARLSNNRFVYTVDASLLREVPVSNQYFRDRLLLRQPDGAIISSLRLRDLESDEVVFEASLPSPDASWKETVAGLPEKQREAVLRLLPELRNLRVQRYMREGFTSELVANGKPISFSYSLEADLLLAGGEAPRKSKLELLLTDRLGGQTLLAGSEEFDAVFAVRQNLLDALAPLLFERSRPGGEKEVAASTKD